MRVLVDTDIFCKLGTAGLLTFALDELGVKEGECGRLPALPHMLRRGGLVRRYGEQRCASLIPLAESLPTVGPASDEWLEPLLGMHNIDAGEAQLIAVAAENSALLLSGDKRALTAIAGVDKIVAALSGRVVVLESMLIALSRRLGQAELRRMLQPAIDGDTVLKVCFSPESTDALGGLESYLRDLEAKVAPLVLWRP